MTHHAAPAGPGPACGEEAEALARELVATYVTAVDPDAVINVNTWRELEEEYSRFRHLLLTRFSGNSAARERLDLLEQDPGNSRAHRELLSLVGTELTADHSFAATLAEALATIRREGLVSYHLGVRHRPGRPVVDEAADTAHVLRVRPFAPRATSAAAPGAPDITVVVPLRAAPGDSGRTRNAVASLAAAADQSLPRERYRIVVVEQDAAPRLRELLADHVDDYVFAHNPGAFNKSWAINIGAATGTRARHLCVLDADVLVEHDHLEEVVRDLDSGPPALLPFGDLLYLDRPSSSIAVEQRIRPEGRVPLELLRGFGLRDVWGACVCLTHDLFDEIGGYDERFRGWGDEDNEFYRQVLRRTGVPRWERPAPHMWHSRPVMVRDDGKRPNQHIAKTPRPVPPPPTGLLDKYRHETTTAHDTTDDGDRHT